MPSIDLSRVRAVAFDGYGTLFEYRVAVDYWFGKELLERQGLPGDHAALEASIRDAWAKVQPPGDLNERMNGPVPEWRSAWAMWHEQYESALGEHGIPGDAAEAADYLRDFLGDLDAYADAHASVERLASKGYVLGVLSNADEDFLQRSLSRSRLRFSVIQSSESLRVYKPHRAAFLALCRRLGHEPDEVLYVGDSTTSDVAAARNAGLRTAWFRPAGATFPPDLPPPDIEVLSLTEVADALGA